MNGGDLYVLRDILGHSSIQMTEKYAHLSPKFLESAMGVVEFGGQPEGQMIEVDWQTQQKA